MSLLDEEDIVLFRTAIKGAKQLPQDTYVSSKQVAKQRINIKIEREKKDHLFYFSDGYEPLLNDEQKVRYLRDGEASHLLKQLRRGDFPPELFLDLHGLTREQAKQELAALLHACEKENIACASVMTGYGTYTLKQQIPRWLVQHPKIRALHQAPKEWGGDAALLLLFEIVE